MASKESLEKNVNHPLRYTKGKVECIDALESAVVGKSPDEAISVANVIKYLWRYEEKEPLRSLMSARWYLDRLIGKYLGEYEPTRPTEADAKAAREALVAETRRGTTPSFVKRDGSSIFNGKVLCTSMEDEHHTMTCSTTTSCTCADDDLTGVTQYCGPTLKEETSIQRAMFGSTSERKVKVKEDMVS